MARNIDDVIKDLYGDNSFTGVDAPDTAEVVTSATETIISHRDVRTPVIIDDPFNQHPYGISGPLGSLSKPQAKPQEDEDGIPF